MYFFQIIKGEDVNSLKTINMMTRFLLEIALLVIFSFWGFRTGNSTLMKIILGIGSPLLLAVVWGNLIAPKSNMRLQDPWLFILEIGSFGLAYWALNHTGKISLAIIFSVIYLINKILMIIWRQ